jgi:protein-ribulosamine 3-kinase
MGEYVSSRTLRQCIPDNIVPPVAWGTFQDEPAKSFFLTHFRNLVERLPLTTELLAIVKKLHQSSTSPNGKFGFPVTTFYGPPPMDNTWTDSWEEYFTREFCSSVAYAQVPLENDPKLAELAESFIQIVIPRLLRPLQTGGNSIKPTLCFGDLWDANIQTDAITNQPVLFDPCSFYGHHES